MSSNKLVGLFTSCVGLIGVTRLLLAMWHPSLTQHIIERLLGQVTR